MRAAAGAQGECNAGVAGIRFSDISVSSSYLTAIQLSMGKIDSLTGATGLSVFTKRMFFCLRGMEHPFLSCFLVDKVDRSVHNSKYHAFHGLVDGGKLF